ncbi:COR2B protein, partial [Atractosteus spatula]|nr:COR2B protein [Atractosteus spatula]
MSWRPQYRSSKFRNVYGKVANREHCFDGIPITKNVHDNHFCAVNTKYLAIVTESAGGGSFLVIPLEQNDLRTLFPSGYKPALSGRSSSTGRGLLLALGCAPSVLQQAVGKKLKPPLPLQAQSRSAAQGCPPISSWSGSDVSLRQGCWETWARVQQCFCPWCLQTLWTGRIDPHYPKVCGHQGNVLDVKWNPFIDNIIASCSEDSSVSDSQHVDTRRTYTAHSQHTACAHALHTARTTASCNGACVRQVRIWEIPEGGLKRNMTEAVLELYGHSRRVGLIEWHPTTNGILFSAGYDYKILIWNLDIGEPVKMIDCHTDVILCMSFNTDGSLLATTCKDKRLRVIEPRSGDVLQEANCKNHKVNRVVFLGNVKRLLTTGVSRWNTRQIALWDQEDLSMPIIEEEIDGLSGLLFPFYDADTHMLYLAGKGDGNIRYYEISTEKPYLQYLMEFRSPAPQKGLGVMPKHGLDVAACEVFRFYKLVTLKGLIEPISMIVPRRSETYQEDIYPMTPGTEPALSADEWLSGINRDPVLMSLREGYRRPSQLVFKAPAKEIVVNGIDLLENVPPRTENEVRWFIGILGWGSEPPFSHTWSA